MPSMDRIARVACLLGAVAFSHSTVTVAQELSAPIPIAPGNQGQVTPSIAVLPDGRFLVVVQDGSALGGIVSPPFDSNGRDGWWGGIVGRVVDASGHPDGEPFVINQHTMGDQLCPRVVVASTGSVVVSWSDADRDHVVFRRLDADGTPTTGEILYTPSDFDLCDHDSVAGADGTIWLALRTQSAIEVVELGTDDVARRRASLPRDPERIDTPRLVPTRDGAILLGVPHRTAAEENVSAVRILPDGSLVGEPIVLGTAVSADAVSRVTPSGEELVIAAIDPALGPTVWRWDVDALDATPRSTPIPVPPPWDRRVALASFDDELVVITGIDSYLTPATDPGRLSIFRVEPEAGRAEEITSAPVILGAASAAHLEVAVNARSRLLVAWEAGVPGEVYAASLDLGLRSTLDLGDGGRFRVEVDWRDFAGAEGDGFAVPLADDTGAFWFFDPANLELTVKVLDGRAINGHFWVFNGSLTNVEYTLTVTDTTTGAVYTVTNPLGRFGSFGDVEALPGQ